MLLEMISTWYRTEAGIVVLKDRIWRTNYETGGLILLFATYRQATEVCVGNHLTWTRRKGKSKTGQHDSTFGAFARILREGAGETPDEIFKHALANLYPYVPEKNLNMRAPIDQESLTRLETLLEDLNPKAVLVLVGITNRERVMALASNYQPVAGPHPMAAKKKIVQQQLVEAWLEFKRRLAE
jgi:hypothetical protein